MESLDKITELAKNLSEEQKELIIQLIYNMIPAVEPDEWEIQAIKEWEAMSEADKANGISLDEYAKQNGIEL